MTPPAPLAPNAPPPARPRRAGLALLGGWLLLIAACPIAAGAAAADEPSVMARGPYRGRVVDAASGRPIAGAAVLVVWEREDPAIPGRRVPVTARGSLTDARGEFSVEGADVERAPGPALRPPRVVIWKPGYTPFPSERRRPPGAPAARFAGAGSEVALAEARTAAARVEAFNTVLDALSGFQLMERAPAEIGRLVAEELDYLQRPPGAPGPGGRR